MKYTKIATALAVILAGKFAYAAEQTMVVSGNILGDSRAEEVKTWAGSRTVISNDQLVKGANRTLDDALQRVPGVKIQDETGICPCNDIMPA